MVVDTKKRVKEFFSNLPGGVPQQSLLSSTCSTSKPINQDPNETSSLAYLCSTCLRQSKTKYKLMIKGHLMDQNIYI